MGTARASPLPPVGASPSPSRPWPLQRVPSARLSHSPLLQAWARPKPAPTACRRRPPPTALVSPCSPSPPQPSAFSIECDHSGVCWVGQEPSERVPVVSVPTKGVTNSGHDGVQHELLLIGSPRTGWLAKRRMAGAEAARLPFKCNKTILVPQKK